MSGYLLDTNVVSELRKGTRMDRGVAEWFAAVEPIELHLSVLVMGEIRGGIERVRPRDAVQARSLERWLMELERRFGDQVLPVTGAIADRWGRMGGQQPVSAVDGLLAATALVHGLVLVTRSVRDVARSGAKVLNPFSTTTD